MATPAASSETYAHARPLTEFLTEAALTARLSAEERLTIVRQATLLLESVYAHLPLKRAMQAVDPVQRLRLLALRLTDTDPRYTRPLPPALDFHREMFRIFGSVCDVHTTYRALGPYENARAILPLTIEAYGLESSPRYVVTQLHPGWEAAAVRIGDEVTHWNGTPIARHVERLAESQLGSNEAARRARAVHALTTRPLSHMPPPDEEWVDLTLCHPGATESYGVRHEWRVTRPAPPPNVSDAPAAPDARGAQPPAAASTTSSGSEHAQPVPRDVRYVSRGVDALTEEVRRAKYAVYDASQRAPAPRPAGAADVVQTTVEVPGVPKGVLRAARVTVGGGPELGYLRIFTFEVDGDALVSALAKLLPSLSPNGLIVDVRGNGGGRIDAAERILQLFHGRPVDPVRAEFLTSPVTYELCQRFSDENAFGEFDLTQWRDSLRQAVETGAVYSRGFPITSRKACNDVGRKYAGPAVLVTDALSLSAADMFAAGFQDHRIGKVIGTSRTTGGAGAETMPHVVLTGTFRETQQARSAGFGDSPFARLPEGVAMSVALRRVTRVRSRAGLPIEGFGVTSFRTHAMTFRDLTEGNVDLIRFAASFLPARRNGAKA
jgi:hypothetical protein